MIGMNTTNTREKIEPLLLTPREAAKALSVCERTLYALTKAGRTSGSAYRAGRPVRRGRFAGLHRPHEETEHGTAMKP